MSEWADSDVRVDSIVADEGQEELIKQEQEKQQKKHEVNEDEVDYSEAAIALGDADVIIKDQVTGETSPYKSATTFEALQLHEHLLIGIKEMGWDTPSKIQAAALPMIIAGDNVVAQGKHGSGKTGTFCLGMLARVDPKLMTPQAICIVNTRELAAQSIVVLSKLARRLGTACYMAVGGEDTKPKFIDQQIIIGTPGRIKSLIQSKHIPMDNIRVVVFDEADTLLDEEKPTSAQPTRGRGGGPGGRPGRGPQETLAQQALFVLQSAKNPQVLFFSATFSEKALRYASRTCPDAKMITIKDTELKLDTILTLHVHCSDGVADAAVDALEDLLEAKLPLQQSIIFCNSIALTKMLTKTLVDDGFQVSMLHGKMSQDERTKTAQDFRDGKSRILVATNLISRGLDVPSTSLVVNFDTPITQTGAGDADTFMHRIGRASRFGTRAVSLTFTYTDAACRALDEISQRYTLNHIKFTPQQQDEIQDQIRNQLA